MIGAGPPGVDPVRGMKVRPDTHRVFEHRGKRYLFCSDGCLKKFSADPEKYLQTKPSLAAMAPEQQHAGSDKIEYTCPMHPEVRSSVPVRVRSAGWHSKPLKQVRRRTPPARRHDTALQDQPAVHGAAPAAGDGRDGRHRCGSARDAGSAVPIQLAASGTRPPVVLWWKPFFGGPVVVPDLEPQHVQPDRTGLRPHSCSACSRCSSHPRCRPRS
jgi:Cu+-exporting ATPase